MSVLQLNAAAIKFEKSSGLLPELKLPLDANQRIITAIEIDIQKEMNAIDRHKMISVLNFLNCLEKLSKSA